MTVYKKKDKYYCRFQIDGERHHYLCTGATTEKEAKKIEAQFMYKIQQQQNGIIPKKVVKIKLSTLCKLYDYYAKTNKKSYGKDAFVKYIQIYFGDIYANDITVNKIEDFKNWLKHSRNSSNSTINKYRAALSKMFNLGIANKLISENPVKDVRAFREDNHKIRYLLVDEENRLYNTIKKLRPYLEPIVTCALQTGMRKGEILGLKWSNIDFDYGFIELLETKSGKSRKIPISKKLMSTFMHLQQDTEYVFVNPETKTAYTDIKHSWQTVLKVAQIKNFRFHDLRHTAITRMVEKGIPLPVIQELAGHQKISTTMRYTHTMPKQKLEAIEVLNSYN